MYTEDWGGRRKPLSFSMSDLVESPVPGRFGSLLLLFDDLPGDAKRKGGVAGLLGGRNFGGRAGAEGEAGGGGRGTCVVERLWGRDAEHLCERNATHMR